VLARNLGLCRQILMVCRRQVLECHPHRPRDKGTVSALAGHQWGKRSHNVVRRAALRHTMCICILTRTRKCWCKAVIKPYSYFHISFG